MKIENGVLVDIGEICPNLVFPCDMVKIDEGVLEYLRHAEYIETIEVEDGNPVFHSNGDCLIETAPKTLVLGSDYGRIPDDGSVIKIGERAFYGRRLFSGKIPECITQIDFMAFAFSQLKNIVLPESVTNIGGLCFALNPKLEIVTIKSENVQIGEMAFATKGEIERSKESDLMPVQKANTLKIYAPKNSTAHEYAKRNGIEFKEIKRLLDGFVL